MLNNIKDKLIRENTKEYDSIDDAFIDLELMNYEKVHIKDMSYKINENKLLAIVNHIKYGKIDLLPKYEKLSNKINQPTFKKYDYKVFSPKIYVMNYEEGIYEMNTSNFNFLHEFIFENCELKNKTKKGFLVKSNRPINELTITYNDNKVAILEHKTYKKNQEIKNKKMSQEIKQKQEAELYTKKNNELENKLSQLNEQIIKQKNLVHNDVVKKKMGVEMDCEKELDNIESKLSEVNTQGNQVDISEFNKEKTKELIIQELENKRVLKEIEEQRVILEKEIEEMRLEEEKKQKKIREQSEKEWKKRYDEAQKLIKNKKIHEAIEILNNLLEDDANPNYYYHIGFCQKKLGRWVHACRMFELAFEKGFEGTNSIYKSYGIALGKMNRTEDSIEAWTKYIELTKSPKFDDYFNVGEQYRILGDMETAEEYLNKAVQILKSNTQDTIWKLYYKKEAWDVAIFFILREIEGKRNVDIDTLTKLANCYEYSFNYEQAQFYAKKIVKNKPTPENYLYLGNLYEINQQFNEAIKVYSKIDTSLVSDRLTVLYRYAYAAYNAGEFKQACELFRAYGNIEDEVRLEMYMSKYLADAMNFELEGNINDAVENYKSAIYSVDEHTPYIYYRLGKLLASEGRYEEAGFYYKQQRVFEKYYGIDDKKVTHAGFKRVATYTEIFEKNVLDSNVVFYCGYNGSSFTGNVYAVFLEHLKNPKLKHVIALQKGVEIPTSIFGIKNVFIVRYDTYAHMTALSSASKIIIDTSLPFYFIPKVEQKILNTWHGTPLKNLGYDINELPYHSSRNVRRVLNISTHIVNPNQFTENVLKKAYTLDEHNNYAVTGYPRQDLMINLSERRKEEIKEYLEIPNDKPIVLYAPTYRGANNKSDNRALEELERAKELLANNPKYHFVYKGHYFEKGTDPRLTKIDSNELLGIADVLITDYSSIGIDYLAMNKPIIYFAFDIDQYMEERGMYIDVEDITDEIVYTADRLELIVKKAVNRPKISKKQKIARELYASQEDGNATKRVVEFLDTDIKTNENNAKKEIAIFTGNVFMTNGITRSFINLLNSIDKDKYNVTIILPESLVNRTETEILDMFYANGHKIALKYYFDSVNLLENRAKIQYNQNCSFYNQKQKDVYMNAVKRNAQRLFGNKVFDAAINYESGYTPSMNSLILGIESKRKLLVLHSDMYSETVMKFPHVRSTFQLYDDYDEIFTVSGEVSKLNINHIGKPYGVEENKFGVLNNIVDYEHILDVMDEPFEVEEDEKYYEDVDFVFISLGRLSPEKNHEMSIRSFAKLVEKYPDLRMRHLIFGTGTIELELRNLIDELNLTDIVILMGTRTNPYSYLKRADCLLFPSLHEGQGLVLFEAYLTNTPIIAAQFPSGVEIIDEYGGVYTSFDVDEYVKAISNYIEGRMDTSNTFDPAAYNENILRTLYKAINKK